MRKPFLFSLLFSNSYIHSFFFFFDFFLFFYLLCLQFYLPKNCFWQKCSTSTMSLDWNHICNMLWLNCYFWPCMWPMSKADQLSCLLCLRLILNFVNPNQTPSPCGHDPCLVSLSKASLLQSPTKLDFNNGNNNLLEA